MTYHTFAMLSVLIALGSINLSEEELHDIFTLIADYECPTHDLLECECDGCGLPPLELDEAPEEVAYFCKKSVVY